MPIRIRKSRFISIFDRWLHMFIVIIGIAAILFAAATFFIVRSFLYSVVDNELQYQYTNTAVNYFLNYTGGDDTLFEEGARSYVANFDADDMMQVSVLDSQGNLIVSSSGFLDNIPSFPDFEEAVISPSGMVSYTGAGTGGENIRMRTYLLYNSDGSVAGAVRYVSSLKEIDIQLFWIVLAILAAFSVLLNIASFFGHLFSNNIIAPLTELNEVTNRISEGDLDARFSPKDYHDEITELGENINHMAEEVSSSDKIKNDFISTVSHEMKTPLTAIKGWAETLMMGGESDRELTKRGLEVIINETEQLTNVVNDLLDLSKIVNGRFTMNYEKVDILSELDDTIYVFKERSLRDGITLNYNVPAEPTPTEGDAARLRQVFVNLLDNAFKYSEHGDTVTVVAKLIPPAEEGDKGQVKIFVEDTGCGIAPEELPRVKEKFYKSNISVQGSGIGLAVCDEIVKLFEGTLELESELGVGTCVTVTLPANITPVTPPVLPEANVAEEA